MKRFRIKSIEGIELLQANQIECLGDKGKIRGGRRNQVRIEDVCRSFSHQDMMDCINKYN